MMESVNFKAKIRKSVVSVTSLPPVTNLPIVSSSPQCPAVDSMHLDFLKF